MTDPSSPMPRGNWRKRGSFQSLVEQIETAADPGTVRLSSAAFRAGALIRMMRKARGISQAELGKKLGVSQARVSELEAGVGSQGPSWSLMTRIADACRAQIYVSPDKSDLAVDAAATNDDAFAVSPVSLAAG